MLTLSYSACYDPYNTVFRMLALLQECKNHTMPVEMLRITDFFLCFPDRLEELRPPNSVKGLRGKCNQFLRKLPRNNFESLPSSGILFERMRIIQETAISALAAKGIIKVTNTKGQRGVVLSSVEFIDDLDNSLKKFKDENADLLEIVAKDIPEIQFYGSEGLKARTGLGDYYYDNV